MKKKKYSIDGGYSNNNNQMNQMSTAVNDIKNDINTAKSNISTLQSNVLTEQTDIDNLKTKINNAESNISNAQSAIQSLQLLGQSYQSQIDSLKSNSKPYAYMGGFSGQSGGYVTLNNGVVSNRNMPINSQSVSLPNTNKTYRYLAIFDATLGLNSAATYNLVGTNCTVIGRPFICVVSLTNKVILQGEITVSNGATNPIVQIAATGLSGTITIGSNSSFSIEEL